MNTEKQNFNERDEQYFILRIIKGGKYNSGKNFIDELWTITKAALWPKEQFSEKEVIHFKQMLAQHFERASDTEQQFKELVERILMTMRYVQRRPWRYLPKPADWLNITNLYGFSGTKSWYAREEIRRAFRAEHNIGIRLVARALLDYCKDGDADQTIARVAQLHQLNNTDLLCLYVSAILQLSNSKK